MTKFRKIFEMKIPDSTNRYSAMKDEVSGICEPIIDPLFVDES